MNALGAPIHSPRNSTKIFEELATRAHDMEQSMIASGEAMAVNATSFKLKGKIDGSPSRKSAKKIGFERDAGQAIPFS